MLIAQPPGVRATRDGGAWTFCRGASGTNHVMNDFAAMEQRLGGPMFELLRHELFFKMRQAELGRLTYGQGSGADVEQMAVAPDVLELRLSPRSGDDDDLLHIRFFFSEPLHRPNLLCGLMLLWKRPGQIGLEDQSAAARLASVRLAEFAAREDY